MVRTRTGKRTTQASAIPGPGGNLPPAPPVPVARLGVLIFGVSVIVLVTHWPALSARALSYDDQQYVGKNDVVQNPGWASAWRFLSEVLEPSTVDGYYQPLTMISLMADYALGGRLANLRTFHRTSLALHVANTVLVIVFLYALFGHAWIAAIVGLMFGTHPMTVETIAWLGERKTLLATFFALSCLILYVGFARRGGWGRYAMCVALFVLGLLSKPTITPLPVLLLLLDAWPLRRRALLEKIPFFLIAAISAAVTIISQGNTAEMQLPARYPPSQVPLLICHNIVFYPMKMLWPSPLSSIYPFPKSLSPAEPMVLAGLIGTIVLAAGLLASVRRTRAFVTGGVFFLVAIAPTFLNLGYSLTVAADKYAYLPSLGFLMIAAWLAGRLWEAVARFRRPAVYRVGILVLALGVVGAEARATRGYLAVWQDSVSLHRHTLTVAPGSAAPHLSLGISLAEEGRLEEAATCYRQALRIRPNLLQARLNLGGALLRLGRINEATRNLEAALRLAPDSDMAHTNLGYICFMQGRTEEAIRHDQQALARRPDTPDALNNLAWIRATDARPAFRNAAEAIRLARRACRSAGEEKRPTMLDTLAAAYAAAGRFPEAVATARQGIARAKAAGQSAPALDIEGRLRLYQAGRPYQMEHKDGETN